MSLDPLHPYTCTASLIINTWGRNGAFVTTDEPAWISHPHLESVPYIRVHSWSCTFYRFGQMFDDMYPFLWNLLCPKNTPPPLPALNLRQPLTFS